MIRNLTALAASLLVSLLLSSCAGTGSTASSTSNSRVSGALSAGRPVKVACIGDSITNGKKISNPANHYPAQLGQMLGSSYQVRGFGSNAAVAYRDIDMEAQIEGRGKLAAKLKADEKRGKDNRKLTIKERQTIRKILESDLRNSFHRSPKYAAARAWNPDIYVVLLGTNDSEMIATGDKSKEEFVAAYNTILDEISRNGAQIYLCTQPKVWSSRAIFAIEEIGRARGLPVIQLRSGITLGPDRVHPNEAGAQEMARRVASAIR